MKIGEQPTDMQASVATPSEAVEKYGMSVQELTPELTEELGLEDEQGVVIASVEPGSPAAEAGIRRGDLLKEINRQSIESLSDYNNAMASVGEDESFLALIRRGENTLYVVVNAE